MTAMVDIADRRARLTLVGKLTYEENESFRESMASLESGAPDEVTIDMAQLQFIDSAGLGMLLLLRDRLPKNTRIALSNANPQVRKILTLTRLDQLFILL